MFGPTGNPNGKRKSWQSYTSTSGRSRYKERGFPKGSGPRQTYESHLRSIDALGNRKKKGAPSQVYSGRKPYSSGPSAAGPGCGLMVLSIPLQAVALYGLLRYRGGKT